MTLKEVEKRSGISFQMLSAYERGEVDPPSSKLPRIAEALDVSVGQLFTRQSPVPTP
jgi:transcriptional regulator with XRE-family HTH domain